MLVMFLGGLIATIAGIFNFVNFTDLFFGVFSKIISSIFLCLGMYMLYRGAQIREASSVLESIK